MLSFQTIKHATSSLINSNLNSINFNLASFLPSCIYEGTLETFYISLVLLFEAENEEPTTRFVLRRVHICGIHLQV